MGRKERRLRDQHELRQSILAAARAIALAEGWSNVTMRKIAEEIEYSHAAIYAYFETKDQLLVELAHEGFRLLEADMLHARANARDPEDALHGIARGYLGFAWRCPELYRLMYGLDGVTFRVSEPKKEGRQIEDVASDTVKAVLEARGWSTEHLADQVYLLWGTTHGLATLALTHRIPGAQDQAARLVDQAIQALLIAWERTLPPAGS
ncbi:MAG TPA: TetR/AcrR family transcriptional regulator [Herpetosiphonaceae bacterium]